MTTPIVCPPDMCRLCVELAGAGDLDETLGILARHLTEVLGARGCTIRLLDERDLTLKIVAVHGLDRGYLDKAPVPLDRHPVDRRVLAGEAIATLDIAAEPHLLYPDEAIKAGIRSVLSVPLAMGEQAIGVVRIYYAEPHEATGPDRDAAMSLAALGGILTDRMRVRQQMAALIDTAQSISSSLALPEVLDRIVASVTEVLGFRAASIRLLDQDRKRLLIQATRGLSREYLAKGPVEVEKSPLDKDCLAGQVVAIADITSDSRLQYREELAREGIGALLSVPLRVRDIALGVLRAYTSRPYTFSTAESKVVAALANQGAIAIENARLFEHIRKEYEELTQDVWKWYDWGKNFPRI